MFWQVEVAGFSGREHNSMRAVFECGFELKNLHKLFVYYHMKFHILEE